MGNSDHGNPYRVTSPIRTSAPLGPYGRTTPMVVLGGWAFSHERGTPVYEGRRGGYLLEQHSESILLERWHPLGDEPQPRRL